MHQNLALGSLHRVLYGPWQTHLEDIVSIENRLLNLLTIHGSDFCKKWGAARYGSLQYWIQTYFCQGKLTFK